LLLAGRLAPRKAGAVESTENGRFLRVARRCNWARGGYSPREIEPLSPGRVCRPVRPEIDTRKASMFITAAHAQGLFGGGGGGDGGSMIMSLLPFALIFVIMYFLILRPQQKKVKSHQEMVKNVRRGDTVITNGGLIGKVTKVIDDDQIEIEIADDVRIRQMRQMVTDVRAKGEPVKDEAASG
jgi:preprotein translocase subunit YajC